MLGMQDDFQEYFDWNVEEFKRLWKSGVVIETHQAGPIRGVTVYRNDPYQVQVWTCPPLSGVPDHTHPNIDTILTYIEGKTVEDFIYLRFDGKYFLSRDIIKKCLERGKKVVGRSFRVLPGRSHGFTTGSNRSVFMAVEKWTGKMTSAELDWVGPPIDL